MENTNNYSVTDLNKLLVGMHEIFSEFFLIISLTICLLLISSEMTKEVLAKLDKDDLQQSQENSSDSGLDSVRCQVSIGFSLKL